MGNIEGIDVYLSCEFSSSGSGMDDWNDQDWEDDKNWDDDGDWDKEDDGSWDNESEDWNLPDMSDGDMNRPNSKKAEARLEVLTSFSTYNDPDMQGLLWIAHLSGMASWLGWIVMLPLGGLLYT